MSTSSINNDSKKSNAITNVLFLCTGNSCRSQMAEGWANNLQLPDVVFHSAGIEAHGLNKQAIAVMAEAGIDISHHQSQTLEQLSNIDFAVIVCVCDNANKRCPTFTADTHVISQLFDDPPLLARQFTDATQQLDCYRRVRDDIKQWITQLPQQLLNSIKTNIKEKQC
ncbi:MAG: arsenate reductase ArsC [Psychrobium sp.]|nr:arsenate reductase ArsC [Psychrobium sp.]